MSLGPEQRARLLRAKLEALVRDDLGLDGEAFESGASAAMVVVDGTAAALLDDPAPATFAGAVLLAARRDVDRLVVYADDRTDVLARWAAYFELRGGGVDVRRVADGAAVEAVAASLPDPLPAPEIDADLRAMLDDAGVDVVVEQGIVRGEVLGLEVARLVRWPADVGGDDELHLEAGVGRFDRDAVAAARPDDPPADALDRAVQRVREHRYPGAPVHPLQVLARSRWLRADVLADPASVGAVDLVAADMTTEAEGLKDLHPAAAVGRRGDGSPLVVVCSSGVDLALVPLAADTRALHDPDAELVVAVPERDLHAATTMLLDHLVRPASAVGLVPGWG
jgi:hypothetical protein